MPGQLNPPLIAWATAVPAAHVAYNTRINHEAANSVAPPLPGPHSAGDASPSRSDDHWLITAVGDRSDTAARIGIEIIRDRLDLEELHLD